MTLFEKIYLTVFLFNLVLFFIGFTVRAVDDNTTKWSKVGAVLILPALLQGLLVILDTLICRLILSEIWELDFTLFPSFWR